MEIDRADTTFDALLLQASQQFEDKSRSKAVTDDFKENSYQSDSGFRQSQNEGDIKQIKENRVPKNTEKTIGL